MKAEISIILLNYNCYKDTIHCVDSIFEHTKNIDFQIIVVDNQSTDDSFTQLKKLKNIVLLQAKKNNGFAAGNNIGIQKALELQSKYVYLLNSDTIIDDSTISNLYKAMENSDIAILGSRIMYHDHPNLIQYLGGHINWKKMAGCHNHEREQFDFKIDSIISTEFITGCSMFIRSSVFDKIGLLPEEYFMYCEDLDFCIQAKLNHLKLAVCTDSVVYHKVGSSSGGENSPFSIKWSNRNRIILIQRYKRFTVPFFTKSWFYLTRYLLIGKYILKNEKEKSKAIIEGLKMGRRYVKEMK